MKLLTRQKTPAEDLRTAAIAAMLSVLEDQGSEARGRSGLTGVRAVLTGAALYTAGFAAFKGRRFLRERQSPGLEHDRAEEEPVPSEEEEELETEGRAEDAGQPDDEPGSKTPTPLPKRKPMLRAARKKGAQPSLELPRQRWTRIPVGGQ